jgi:TRAP-type C4-dicarboxylate transport system substrate-binding protein
LILAEKISRRDAVSLVNDIALGFAALGVVGGEILRELGLSELPYYFTSFYSWGRELSDELPKPIPRELAERAREVLREKLEERLAQLNGEEEGLRGIGYTDRDFRILESHYRSSYEAAVAALDKLSQALVG